MCGMNLTSCSIGSIVIRFHLNMRGGMGLMQEGYDLCRRHGTDVVGTLLMKEAWDKCIIYFHLNANLMFTLLHYVSAFL